MLGVLIVEAFIARWAVTFYLIVGVSHQQANGLVHVLSVLIVNAFIARWAVTLACGYYEVKYSLLLIENNGEIPIHS